jgi:hypothetical protein
MFAAATASCSILRCNKAARLEDRLRHLANHIKIGGTPHSVRIAARQNTNLKVVNLAEVQSTLTEPPLRGALLQHACKASGIEIAAHGRPTAARGAGGRRAIGGCGAA